jgi:prepilin-type N-terminal cleavage/methylation domain-containing protein
MKFKIGEKGFTLIEVLVTLAILSSIITVMTATLILIQRTNSQNDEWNVNLRQVQNAGHWISTDALMSDNITVGTGSTFLTLRWSDWDNNSYNVEYVFQGNTLMRQLNGGAAIMIAQYIMPASTCSWNGTENKLTVTIKASFHGDEDRCVQRTYEIKPRPALGGG